MQIQEQAAVVEEELVSVVEVLVLRPRLLDFLVVVVTSIGGSGVRACNRLGSSLCSYWCWCACAL